MKNKIILASSSPRRKELFDKYGIDYTVDFVETEEVLDESLTLFKRLENIALQKAKPLQIKYPNNIIVSADTMVTFQDEMLGKPKDREDAKRMLNMLSNNKQVVITAVCVIKDQQITTFTDATTVTFKELSNQEIKGSLATLLRSSLKNSDDLKYAMLTGIQRVAKENIFSDLNNLVVCDVTDQRYASYFGFTNNETQELLEYYGLELNDEVKKMYDGYHIGNQDIYNPWSLLNYADTQKLISFWVNTSANSMIKNALKQADYTFKNQYDKLIKESKLDTYVSMQTSFFEEANNSTLWGLFVNAGYLTVTKEINLLKGKYRIEIPNEEVKQEFIKLTEYQLGLSSGTLDTVTESLVNEDQETFLENYQEILMIPSYHDLEKENSYHMMMLGMCLCLNKDYEIISNRKVGKGRDDLILKAKDEKRTSFVLEFKYLKEDKKALEEALDELSNKAIQQIKENKYDYGLKGKVIYIGLAHHGKNVSVKWENKI